MSDKSSAKERQLNIIIAPDSFKGSNTTITVAKLIEKGFRKVFDPLNVTCIPIADGGEGTVEALVLGAGGVFKEKEVTGPMGESVKAKYGVLSNGVAVVELAAASGLPLVPINKKNPLIATTYGTGQLIKQAIDDGCKKIMLAIGGSATNDGGLGIAQALGLSFKDGDGKELGYGGGELSRLCQIDISGIYPPLLETEIVIACDVSNPLCGPKGASAVYGPQKGASPEMVKTLDDNLKRLAEVIKRDFGKDLSDIPGMGAAGGASVPLFAFANAKLRPGIEIVLDVTDFDKHAQSAHLVITGEGRIDSQSVYGKVPVGVGMRAKKFGLPVLAIVGDIGDGAAACYEHGVDGIMSTVNKAMPLEEAMRNSGPLIEDCAERVARIIKLSRGL